MKISKAVLICITAAVQGFAVEAQTTYSAGAARVSPGLVAIEGNAGNEPISAVNYQVPLACAGKMVMLAAEFRTQDIGTGSKPYHGVHFDYEIRIGGKTSWSNDWEEEPSSEWKLVTRTWEFPTNMERATIRIGLQGVNGRMEVRKIRISSC
jgi:hypothetical protein